LWSSDPFEPVERDGRLYGRGAADDKSGVMAHIAVLRAFGDDLPVGVTVLIEGEEEYGSGTLGRLVAEHRDLLDADVIVVADSDNWEIGRPALTTSLRGTLSCYVDVSTLRGAAHSGQFGGPVPDALTVLSRLLATLHDDDGSVAVAGLAGHRRSGVDLAEDHFRAQAGLLDSVRLLGEGRLTDRLWHQPSVTVLGIDAPPAASAPNSLVPTARAKIGVRLAPGDDPAAAYAALRTHLTTHLPWNARVGVTLESAGAPCHLDTVGPAYAAARAAITEAWDGTAPVDIGIGGSIPCVALLRAEFPSAAMLVTGVEDPHCAAHGPDEGLHLADFARTCLAEAFLLRNLASTPAVHDG
jgi:acetylornithine deacetylase/succinyl-diaminopimelate desuccinylase-like protein